MILKHQDPLKYKSKDLIKSTGDKHSDLHALSKRLEFIKPKRDKSTHDIEFEKSKEECTFKPTLGKGKSSKNLFSSTMNPFSRT